MLGRSLKLGVGSGVMGVERAPIAARRSGRNAKYMLTIVGND